MERHALTITRISLEIVYNRGGFVDSINGNTQWVELQLLEFHAIWDKGMFYGRFFDKVEWFYSISKYLFKSIVRT